MSALIVSEHTIDYLIAAALAATEAGVPCGLGGLSLASEAADGLGRMLWAENVTSVTYRYPDHTPDELPGPLNTVTDATVAGYEFSALVDPVDPVVALKQIACYEYQSCEHPGWEVSAAHEFCQQLRSALITMLPGYGDAPWGMD